MRFGFLRVSGLMLAGTFALSACGGGSHSSIPALGGSGSAPGAPVASAPATFTFTFPKSTSSAGQRSPKYLSSATKSVTLQVTDTKNHGDHSDIYANVPAALKAVQVANFANLTGNPSTPGQCGTDPSNAGNYKCTATFQVPIGDDTMTLTSWDANGGTGNKLSQQISTEWAQQGVTNTFAISLDANAAAITVSGTGACTTGPVGASFGAVGTSPVNFTVAYTDPDSKTIVAPGLPKLAIEDNTATYQTTSGTINGTGGTVSFTINQSAQTFTLTPSNSSVTNATVNIKATPANGTDGLSFSQTRSFAFSTGPAPPSSFMAGVEQTGTNSGKIDLYTLSLGASDTFTPYTVSSLAVTNSTNENKPDVDNPRDLLFDSTGNLLIANGGQGGTGGDYGDFACVPAGAIATGSSTTTTSSPNAYDPESIAIGTDSSVAMGNVPAGATYNLVEYVLGTTYTAAPASRDIANPGNTLGTTGVAALPSLPAGTFAAAITNGTTISHIAIKSASGSETDLTDTDISSPEGVAWDATNNQLAIVNHAITTTSGINHNTSKLVFFTVSPGSKVKSVQLGTDPTTSTDSYMFGDKVAVSPDGHVAVAGGTADGPEEVRVFDNTAVRAPVGGPLPFDTYTDNLCSSGYFGTVTIVHGMRWLSNTKLLVALQANTAGKQGFYIFDISTLVSTPGGLYRFDGNAGNCNPVNDMVPKQTGFQAITNVPLGAAYKP